MLLDSLLFFYLAGGTLRTCKSCCWTEINKGKLNAGYTKFQKCEFS